MFKLKVTYKGRPYNDLSDAFSAAIVEGMKELVDKKLAPFKSEIEKEGGVITMDVKEDYKMNILIDKISPELKKKIEAALN